MGDLNDSGWATPQRERAACEMRMSSMSRSMYEPSVLCRRSLCAEYRRLGRLTLGVAGGMFRVFLVTVAGKVLLASGWLRRVLNRFVLRVVRVGSGGAE